MLRTLLAFVVTVMAFPSFVLAAAGDSCTIARATAGQASPNIVCTLGVDATAGGAFTAGPIYVSGGGVGASAVMIRPLSGNSASGCGYDDVIVYETNAPTLAASTEKASIGVLDDDGTSTPTGGVQSIKVFGPTGPYLYFSGTATAGTCNASNRLQIQILVYPNTTF